MVSAAALAHDLGHPPFGHAAEDELDELIRKCGSDSGFEGNPQSFRIVNHVETNATYHDHPDDSGKGLNLTKRTLNAILKYPWGREDSIPDDINEDPDEKFGYYGSEDHIFDWAREGVRDHYKTPEATLMDWADDVTYAVHDLIDFYRVGVIPLGEIFQETEEREAFLNHFRDKQEDDPDISDEFDPEEFLEDTLEGGLDEPEIRRSFQSTRQAESLVDFLQSDLIADFLDVPEVVSYVPPSDTDFDDGLGDIRIRDSEKSQVEFLKEITFHYVIESSSLKSQQHGERGAIATIFQAFLAASDEQYGEEMAPGFGQPSEYDIEIVPNPYQNELKNAGDRSERARIIGDAIANLTEDQAISLYERVSGLGPGSITEQIL